MIRGRSSVLVGLLEHRYLIRVMSVHDFTSQHLDSVLGTLWSMVKPLVLIGLYAFVFSSVMGPTVVTEGTTTNFGMFLFAGMLPWTAIQESVQRSATVFNDQIHLVRHHTIPLYIYPLTIVLSSTISAFFVVFVYLLFKVFMTSAFPAHVLLLILILPLQVVFCYGFSLLVSTLNVFIRDINPLTATVLAVLFFTSPIIFPPENLSRAAVKLMWLNPITGFVLAYRDLLLMNRLPAPASVLSIVLFTILSLLAGMFLYARLHRRIVDRI